MTLHSRSIHPNSRKGKCVALFLGAVIFAQAPLLKSVAATAPPDVKWVAPTNPWPAMLWTYRTEETVFSPGAVSNLLCMTGFTGTDKNDSDPTWITFSRPNIPGWLGISRHLGSIQYFPELGYGPTNLAKNLPNEQELWRLTTNFLTRLNIDPSELLRKRNSDSFDLKFLEQPTLYYVKNTVVTNIPYREVNFTRCVDGVRFIGYDRGGDGEVAFGEDGRVCKIRLSWRKIKRDGHLPTVTPSWIMKWIRDGNVVPAHLRGKAGPVIDHWDAVTTITIKDAWACCRGEDYSTQRQPVLPSPLIPFACVLASVDTPDISTEVLIDCPIFDHAKSAPRTKSP